MKTSLVGLVLWLLIGGLAAGAAFWQWRHPPRLQTLAQTAPGATPSLALPAAPPLFQLPPLEHYRDIIAHPVFIAARQPEPRWSITATSLPIRYLSQPASRNRRRTIPRQKNHRLVRNLRPPCWASSSCRKRRWPCCGQSNPALKPCGSGWARRSENGVWTRFFPTGWC